MRELLALCTLYEPASTVIELGSPLCTRTTNIKAESYHRTDSGNADMLHDVLEGSAKYVEQHKDWAHFDGNTWRLRNSAAAYKAARLVSATRLHAAEIMPDANDEQRTQKRKAMTFAYSCENVAKITALLSLAAKDQRMLASAEDFDSDPYLLGVKNGILNLKTGALMPADKSQLISK